ncbi:MAG: phage protein Gp36 family protein, partial [Alphaproteobacteria bacterium]
MSATETPYARVQDMLDRFGKSELTGLTDPGRNAIVDDALVERALADAKGLMDAAITDRLPPQGFAIGAVPPLLTRLAADIARYLLHDDRAPKAVRQRYEDAMDLLARIGRGELAVTDENGAPVGA